MKWDIDPHEYFIHGEITYFFNSLVENLDEFVLELSQDLQVLAIQRSGQNLSFSHQDDLIRIALGKNLQFGERDTISVTYEGIPPTSGFGSFVQDFHNGQPIIWTLSEPYGQLDWWPGKHDLVDKVDSLDIWITTPSGQLAASNGRLISITDHDNLRIHHWSHRYPIASYLIAIAVTNYEAYSHYFQLPGGDALEVLNYVYPESAESAKEQTLRTLDFLEIFSDLFGIYPFAAEKYGHAQFGWGGGMEHQTMSFMVNFGFELLAHELAHQWFGNKVTCGSWQEVWLNEGFATYMTGLAYEALSPDLYWGIWKNNIANNATSQPGGSVFVEDTTDISRIFSGRLTYNKAAYLLHMLRWIMGDEAFFSACRNYLDSPETAYAFGTTDKLKAHLEHQSGLDLSEFFTDWYFGEGYPAYQLTWSHMQDSIMFSLGQQTSHPSVSFFEMPVPVHVYRDGEISEFILDHSYNQQRYSFYIGHASIDSVALDPDRWILSRNNTVEEIMTAVENGADVQQQLSIFPNPARCGEEVRLNFGQNHFSRISITDIYGRNVASKLKYVEKDDLLSFVAFQPGVFFISLYDQSTLTGMYKLIVL